MTQPTNALLVVISWGAYGLGDRLLIEKSLRPRYRGGPTTYY